MLLKNFKPGETLESAFLKTRSAVIEPDYPMISTDENDQIVAEIYSKITPYLYYYNPHANIITNYILNNSNNAALCKREDDFKRLISSIKQLQTIISEKNSNFNTDELTKLLTVYKNIQDQILRSANKLGDSQLSNKEKFIKKLGPYKSSLKNQSPVYEITQTWKEILLSDTDKIISDNIKSLAKATDSYDRARIKAANEAWKEIKLKKQSILSAYPNIMNSEKVIVEMTKQFGENRETAAKIARQEKKLYNELYINKKPLNFNEPCRQIKF